MGLIKKLGCELAKSWRHAKSRVVAAVAVCYGLVLSGKANAEPDPLIPDTGIDIGEFITEAAVSLGAIVAIVVGVYFAFMLVRMGIKWARGAF